MTRRWLLPILTVVMGMQLLRVFIPSLAWYLRDTVGLSSVSLAPYAFGTFLVAFLAAPLRRLAGSRNAVRLTAIGVAALRAAEQLSADPAVDLWLSVGGMALFVVFIPLYLGHLRPQGVAAVERWTFGIPLGLATDIGLHGAAGTLDLSWVAGVLPVAIVLLLAALATWSAWSLERVAGSSETSWSAALPLLAIGPLLLLQLLVLQSSGWVEEVSRAGPPWGFAIVMLGNLALVYGVGRGWATTGRRIRLLALGATLYLTLGAAYATTPGLPFVLSLILTQLVLGWGWGVICQRSAAAEAPGLGRTGVSLPLGTLLFLALAFVYYLALDVTLPFPREAVLPFSAAVYGLMVVLAAKPSAETGQRATAGPQPASRDPTATVGRSSSAGPTATSKLPLGAAAVLLLVPWTSWLARGPLPQARDGSPPVRIMTYNIHSGFGAAGRHDPEAIARVIEDSGAGIVALQEVSRVRLLDGGTDLAGWLSRRLGMPVVFRGTEEPIWGNAILSRYPISDSGAADLPREGALIGRGYIWAELDVGFPLLVINAHLHHVEEDHHIRLVEVPVLLEFWDQRPHTVLLGDLNAEPHYPEMALPVQAGLIDAWGAAGAGLGFTWSAADPIKRIDWIWTSPDLQVTEITVVPTLASDHLPVMAEIVPSP